MSAKKKTDENIDTFLEKIASLSFSTKGSSSEDQQPDDSSYELIGIGVIIPVGECLDCKAEAKKEAERRESEEQSFAT